MFLQIWGVGKFVDLVEREFDDGSDDEGHLGRYDPPDYAEGEGIED
jgi:hypothetical protein